MLFQAYRYCGREIALHKLAEAAFEKDLMQECKDHGSGLSFLRQLMQS